jgi:multisubunit Na+/H+ antiporter MnhF subunit
MNWWLWAATAVIVGGLLPCLGVSLLAASRTDALVALEAASATTTVTLLLLVQGLERSILGTLALVLAISSFPGTLLFVRLLGRAP